MKLYGQDVPQSVIDAANAAMVGRFKFADVSFVTFERMENWSNGFELAHRLIQRARKAGKIRYEGGYWHEVVK